jgi:basic membrane lipoprotein Med (substrate-binding protein (PBP1-ABC) superfamily)
VDLLAGARWTAAAVAGAAALAVAGCGAASTPKSPKVAIAVSGGEHDIGWSQQGVLAARQVTHGLHIPLVVAQRLGPRDPAATLRRLADGGATLVIAHGRGYAPAAAAVAAQTKVPELGFGAPGALRADRVGDIEVASEQGGYLAGYISARASFVRHVGIVVASDDPNWYRTAGGFVAGTRRFDPHVKIDYARVGGASDDDIAASRQAAHRMILHGAQMVLGLGESSTLGVMRATQAAQEGIGEPRFDSMFVDVIGDKAGRDHISITGLTAVKWNFAPAYRQALADLRAGIFGRRVYKLDLANGGVSVIHEGRTPQDTYEIAMGLGRRIARGKLAVPVVTTDAQLLALLRQKPPA